MKMFPFQSAQRMQKSALLKSPVLESVKPTAIQSARKTCPVLVYNRWLNESIEEPNLTGLF